jgi:hypothetical protein
VVMPESSERKGLYISALPDYEMKLLTAMSFFLGRGVSSQATAALAMYLRQSHDRVMAQTEYYAHRSGMNKWDFLDLIFENPQKAEELMRGTGEKIHAGKLDVFSEAQEDE